MTIDKETVEKALISEAQTADDCHQMMDGVDPRDILAMAQRLADAEALLRRLVAWSDGDGGDMDEAEAMLVELEIDAQEFLARTTLQETGK